MVVANEFSRKVLVEPWPENGIELNIEAGPAELASLARRMGLIELRSLHGHGRLDRSEDGREIRLRGWLEAEVVQSCVVSLEPVAATIEEVVIRRYRRDAIAPERVLLSQAEIELEDEDEIEPLTDSELDLGEVFAEALALALDPYPRAPDADALVADYLGPRPDADERSETPFAVLRQHMDKLAR